MKKVLPLLLALCMLTALAVGVSAKTAVLFDPASMTQAGQSTQDGNAVCKVADGAFKVWIKDDSSANWTWLIFDEYKHQYDWSEYDGVFIRVATENATLFGLNGMPDNGQTGRVEFQASGIVAYDAAGNDVSGDLTPRDDWSGAAYGSSGDPCFAIPANFDGWLFFPYSGANLDSDCDLKDINTMACFVFGEDHGEAYGVSILGCYLYTGDTYEALVEIDPSVLVEEEDEETEAAEAEVSETAEAAPKAAATADPFCAALALLAVSSCGIVTVRKNRR